MNTDEKRSRRTQMKNPCPSVAKNASPPRDQNSLPPTVVLAHGFDNPLLRFKNLSHFVGLSVAEFRHEFAAGLEKLCGLRREQRVKIQPVRPAIERRAWIEIPHFRLQRRDFAARNVRRVADDEIE